MNTDRRVRLWGLVVDHAYGGPVAVEHVCAAALSVAGVDGAAVSVVLSATPWETICASDPVASRLEELALALGEGPGVDAVAGIPCLVADLRAAEVVARWPVFVLGLRGGGTRLGAMGLHRGQPGGLGPGRSRTGAVSDRGGLGPGRSRTGATGRWAGAG